MPKPTKPNFNLSCYAMLVMLISSKVITPLFTLSVSVGLKKTLIIPPSFTLKNLNPHVHLPGFYNAHSPSYANERAA